MSATDPSVDMELLAAWRKGDGAAGNRLFEQHFDALYAFFEQRVRRDAEDLVQQTFLACLSPGSDFRGDSSFRSYLLAAARRKLLDYYRTHHRKVAPLDFPNTTLRDLGTPLSSQLARRQTHRLLMEATHNIPLDLQIAVDLFYFKDMSAREVAVVLSVPEGTVRSRLRRAIELIRTELYRLAPEDSPAHKEAQKELDALEAQGS